MWETRREAAQALHPVRVQALGRRRARPDLRALRPGAIVLSYGSNAVLSWTSSSAARRHKPLRSADRDPAPLRLRDTRRREASRRDRVRPRRLLTLASQGGHRPILTLVQEMVIYGVSFDMVGKQPIVLLKAVDTNKFLPIWIGHPEAAAILMKLQGASTPRPMTHDLLFESLGEPRWRAPGSRSPSCARTRSSRRSRCQGGREVEIDSRPSDAIALALRAGAPIFAAEDVITESAIEFEHEVEDTEEVVDKFKEFLDRVTPEDFAGDMRLDGRRALVTGSTHSTSEIGFAIAKRLAEAGTPRWSSMVAGAERVDASGTGASCGRAGRGCERNRGRPDDRPRTASDSWSSCPRSTCWSTMRGCRSRSRSSSSATTTGSGSSRCRCWARPLVPALRAGHGPSRLGADPVQRQRHRRVPVRRDAALRGSEGRRARPRAASRRAFRPVVSRQRVHAGADPRRPEPRAGVGDLRGAEHLGHPAFVAPSEVADSVLFLAPSTPRPSLARPCASMAG